MSLEPVTPMMIIIQKVEYPFINDSFANHASKNMTGPLLTALLYFSSNEKD